MFTPADIKQIKERGSHLQEVERQIENFVKGFPYASLIAAATPANGINRLKEDEIQSLENYYEQESKALRAVKFVPASGAASRMFKLLFEFMQDFNATQGDLEKLFTEPKLKPVKDFFDKIHNFPFFDDLALVMDRAGLNIEDLLRSKNLVPVLEYLLLDKGLGYSKLPKGLLRFHAYKNGDKRLSIEEHLVEGAVYAADAQGDVRMHFTVSPEHLEKFKEAIEAKKGTYEQKYKVRYHISFSEQKASTDTIAVNPDNSPFREDDGSLLFRPGGHGALIENLNDLTEPLIFIKNIDNVVPDSLKADTFRFKKVIGGVLLKTKNQVHNYLKELKSGTPGEAKINEIAEYCDGTLFMKLCAEFNNLSAEEKCKQLINKLDRPIRVCGMVKNEGEPGGGPYLVKNQKGHISLQIIESSQMDSKNEAQMELVKNATHFNPVDLVCYTYNYNGEKFDLTQYVDPATGFISEKSKDGKDIKAQELPGLWNGAMARWITLFVEVPIITFNPVKTINDLLRKEHQAG